VRSVVSLERVGDFGRICSHLKMFEEATKMMSAEKHPTILLVMPLFIELFSYIQYQVENTPQDGQMKGSLTAFHTVLAKYYSFIVDSLYYHLTVQLDSIFKKIHLERKEFEDFYPGLIGQSVLLLKNPVNKKYECCGTADLVQINNPVRQSTTLFLSMFSHSVSEGLVMGWISALACILKIQQLIH